MKAKEGHFPNSTNFQPGPLKKGVGMAISSNGTLVTVEAISLVLQSFA